MGQHRLAGSGLPFQEKWHFKGHRNIDDFGQFVIEHILRGAGEFLRVGSQSYSLLIPLEC